MADALAKFQADGGTLEGGFRKWAQRRDWSLPRHRLETIYRNAAQTAYMAGHRRRFDASSADLRAVAKAFCVGPRYSRHSRTGDTPVRR
ncbi:MAG: hypothetical protein ACK4MJ_00100 [Hylemonella sp.]